MKQDAPASMDKEEEFSTLPGLLARAERFLKEQGCSVVLHSPFHYQGAPTHISGWKAGVVITVCILTHHERPSIQLRTFEQHIKPRTTLLYLLPVSAELIGSFGAGEWGTLEAIGDTVTIRNAAPQITSEPLPSSGLHYLRSALSSMVKGGLFNSAGGKSSDQQNQTFED